MAVGVAVATFVVAAAGAGVAVEAPMACREPAMAPLAAMPLALLLAVLKASPAALPTALLPARRWRCN